MGMGIVQKQSLFSVTHAATSTDGLVTTLMVGSEALRLSPWLHHAGEISATPKGPLHGWCQPWTRRTSRWESGGANDIVAVRHDFSHEGCASTVR